MEISFLSLNFEIHGETKHGMVIFLLLVKNGHHSSEKSSTIIKTLMMDRFIWMSMNLQPVLINQQFVKSQIQT